MKAPDIADPPDAPKYERACCTILERLRAGRYPVAMRMPTEGGLAASFGISRVTIRPAPDMLVQDGHVESRQGSGYRVITHNPPHAMFARDDTARRPRVIRDIIDFAWLINPDRVPTHLTT